MIPRALAQADEFPAVSVTGRTVWDFADSVVDKSAWGLDVIVLLTLVIVLLNWQKIARLLFPKLFRFLKSHGVEGRVDRLEDKLSALDTDFRKHDDECEKRGIEIRSDLNALKDGATERGESLARIEGYLQALKEGKR